MAAIDVDGDGVGEYGTFGEMTGADGPRTSPDGSTRAARLGNPVLSPALAGVDASGIVTKSGYAFRIFLPGEQGAVHEGSALGYSAARLSGPVATNQAEWRWCAYAWPVVYGNSGNRAFLVDANGDVWQSENKVTRYQGTRAGCGPRWDAALPDDARAAWAIGPRQKVRGQDLEIWTPTN
jgi:hypothetical protein